MIAAITTLDLSFRRKSLIGYSVGMAVYVLVVVVLYPSFKDSTDLDTFTESSPGVAALFGIAGSLTSPVGWLSANVYANFFPLILLVLTIGYGAFCLAGQERDGQLELVLSLPLRAGGWWSGSSWRSRSRPSSSAWSCSLPRSPAGRSS